jgi:hypothetical protein
MGTKYDPNHPHRPRGSQGSAVEAYRNHGEEAPWLLLWRGGEVVTNPETGRYMYHWEHDPEGQLRGRGGRRA